MTKSFVGVYKYRGFLINYSEYYQEWTLEPTFLGDSDKAINFSIEYNNDCEGFKTIKDAKRYIKDNENELKENVLKLFNNYRGE